MGREDDTPLPLDVAGPPPGPARSSAMEAFSSISSGENGYGCLSASSRTHEIALFVCAERRTMGCGSGLFAGGDCNRWRNEGECVEASRSSSLRSCESCRRGVCGEWTRTSFPSAGVAGAVANRGLAPIPTVTASRWTRRRIRGAWKGGVRRSREDGVGGREGEIRCWRCVGIIWS